MSATKPVVPAWRQRLCTLLVHPSVAASIKADVKAAIDEIDRLQEVIDALDCINAVHAFNKASSENKKGPQ